MDWKIVWAFLWPILKQAVIALLVAILAILGYDARILPGRLLTALKAMGFKVEKRIGSK
jgi:uroporphyrinogen-III decarboxylase